MTKIAQPTFMKDPEVAALLRIDPVTLRIWRNQRRGPPWIKVGEMVRYDHAAVVAWLNERTVVPKNNLKMPLYCGRKARKAAA